MICLAGFTAFVFTPILCICISPNLMQFGNPSRQSFDFAREQLKRCNGGNTLHRIYMVNVKCCGTPRVEVGLTHYQQ